MYPTLESASDILKMLDELTEHRQSILARCAKLPVAKLLEPTAPGAWSVLKLLAHLAMVEEFMLGWIESRPGVFPQEKWPKEPALELKAIETALDEAHAASIAFLKSHPEAVLREPCLYGRKQTPQTVGGVFFHLVEHEIHHRAFALGKLAALEAAAAN